MSDSFPKLDVWISEIGAMSNVGADLEAFKNWRSSVSIGGYQGNALQRAMFDTSSGTIANMSKLYETMNATNAIACIGGVRVLLSQASCVTNWPGMRDFNGRNAAAIVYDAVRNFVMLCYRLDLTVRDTETLIKMVMVDIVCGKVGAYIRYVELVGEYFAGSRKQWLSYCNPYLQQASEATILRYAHYSGMNSGDAAHEFGKTGLADVAKSWDEWQDFCSKGSLFGDFDQPDVGNLSGHLLCTGYLRGWCQAFEISPVDCVLPMPSDFAEKAATVYDKIVSAGINGGKSMIL